MSIAAAPVPVVNGQAVQLPQPQSYALAAVTISNLSAFVLTVAVGASTALQQPYTEQLYSLAGALSAPIGVVANLPTGQPPGATAQVAATWFAADEVPKGSWPVSLSALANNSPGVLSNNTITTTATITDGVTYDVSRFASVLFTYSAYKATPNNTPAIATFTVNWLISGQVIATDVFSFIDSDRNDSYILTSREPVSVKGTAMRFSISAPPSQSTVTYQAIGFATTADTLGYREQSGYWGRSGFGAPATALGLDGYSVAYLPSHPGYSPGPFSYNAYPNTRPGPMTVTVAKALGAANTKVGITVTDVVRNVTIGGTTVAQPATTDTTITCTAGTNPVTVNVTQYTASDPNPCPSVPVTITQ